jgi:NodT family efflux transporter outer membrane factor (OMF) lipoprotein
MNKYAFYQDRFSSVFLICLSLILLTGCAVGPDFKSPEAKIPASWTGSAAESQKPPVNVTEKNQADWWKVFNDSILTSLIERAVSSNLDLKQAEAQIRKARAERGVTAAGIGPELNAGGSYERSRTSVSSGSQTEWTVSDRYQTGFDAIWELDIFGGVRRSIEASDADIQASIESQRDVLVTLTAEVALNYIELRGFQQRIEIARKNLKAQEHSVDLTRQRFQTGFVGGLDVANAEAQVATTTAQIPALEASVRQSIHRLSILLGMEPAALIQELSPASSIPGTPPLVPAGVPSDLLRRRPDIRKAEARIHVSTARIGVAEADLYPQFTLTGSVAIEARNPGPSFSWSNRIWSFGPSARLPIFNMGRIRSNIKLQEALNEQELITYQQTVLTALREVEDALIASDKEQERREALVKAVDANRKAVELATMLYTQGETDFLNVLEAQRALYITEDALAGSTQTLSTQLVALYKALGGGWVETPDDVNTATAR